MFDRQSPPFRKRRGRVGHPRGLVLEKLEVLGFPLHGVVDAAASGRMIEEDPLFDRAGGHFAIFAEMNRGLGESVGLAAGVDTVHVGFVLVGANVCVENRRKDKEKCSDDQQSKRQNGRIANAGDLPSFAIACQGPAESPTKNRKENHDDNGKEKNVLRNVVEDVVTHFVTHDGLNFFRRAAAEKIVVERDAHGLAEAADIGAHAGGLLGSVDFEDVVGGNPVRARHREDGSGDFGIVKAGNFVEQREDEHRGDHDAENEKANGDDGAPDVPASVELANDGKENGDQ